MQLGMHRNIGPTEAPRCSLDISITYLAESQSFWQPSATISSCIS